MNDGRCTLWCGSHRGHRARREIAFLFVSMNDGGCTLWCGARGDTEGTERHGRLSTVYIYRLCLSAVEESPLPIHFLHYFTLPTLYFRLHMARTEDAETSMPCTGRRCSSAAARVAACCDNTTKIYTKNHPLQQRLLQGVVLHATRYDLATGK